MFMRDYGYWLDKMKPHWVTPFGKPLLMEWTREKYGYVPSLIYVRPHPWIAEGIKDARKELKQTFGNGYTIRFIRRKSK